MKAWLNGEMKNVTAAALLLGGMSVVSRGIGLVRDRVLASQFGAGETLDVYYAAFRLPDFVFTLLVAGAISASFIPFFLTRRQEGDRAGWTFVNQILIALSLVLVIVLVFLAVAARPLASWMAPGFPAELQDQVAEFMRVLFLAEGALGISLVFGSVLQGLKRFFSFSLSPLFYNLGIMVGAIAFVPWLGPIGLAWGVVLGAGMHLLVQSSFVYHLGYRFVWVRTWWGKETRDFFLLSIPRMLGLLATQLTMLALTVFATYLSEGSVTVYTMAYNIQFFAVGLVGISYAVAVFPTLSEAARDRRFASMRETIRDTTLTMTFFLVPMMIATLVLRAQIVRLVVGDGAFAAGDVYRTADALAAFAISFIPQAFVYLLARAFFALKDTMTPLIAAAVGASVSLATAIWFSRLFGVAGFGAALSLGVFAQTGLLWLVLRARLQSLGEAQLLPNVYKLAVSGLVLAVVMQVVKTAWGTWIPPHTLWTVTAQTAVTLLVGGMTFVALGYMLRIPQAAALWQAVHSRLFVQATPVESVTGTDGSVG